MSVTANIQQFETGDRVEELLKRVDGDWGAKRTYTRDLKDLDIGWSPPKSLWRTFDSILSDSLLTRLKSWIDPPTWAYAFENSQLRRSERTTEWFLKHDKVSRWLSQLSPERKLSALPVQGRTSSCMFSFSKSDNIARQTWVWENHTMCHSYWAYPSLLYELFNTRLSGSGVFLLRSAATN